MSFLGGGPRRRGRLYAFREGWIVYERKKTCLCKAFPDDENGERTVCVGDIGQVYCSDPAAAAKVRAIRAASFPKAVRRTAVCGDIMELIRLAQEADPQIQIVNLGGDGIRGPF